jgi:cobalamin biosynthesis Mg chelatase CobN
MKRHILIIASVLALLLAGAVFAQSPQNTTAPGPTQQREPGQTNNNLPNPGNPQTDLTNRQTTTPPANTTSGTVEGSAAESIDRTQQGNTTGTTTTPPADTTGTMNDQTGTTTGTTGTMNDQTGTTTTGTTGTYSGTATDTTSGTSSYDTNAAGTLPSTASPLPALILFGLLALGTAFAVRIYRKA